jgi:hypothetical protein
MTPVAQTSIESFRKLKHIGKRQAEVLAVFKKYPQLRFSDRELSKLIHQPINRVTPRRGELAEKGLVCEAGFLWDAETKRRVQAWKLKNNPV